MKKLPSSLLLGLALCGPVLAQTESAPVLGKPAFEVSVLGPAAWRARFAPTNVGSLLAAEAARDLWEPQLAQLEQLGNDSLGAGNNLFQILREQAAGYGGEVRLLGWISGSPGDGDKGPPAFGVVFGPDGKTDLAKMAQMLADVIAKAAEAPWKEEQIGDRKLGIIESNGERISAPVVEGDRIWMAYGDSKFASVIDQTRAVVLTKPAGDAPPLAARIDMQIVLGSLEKGGGQEIASMGVSSIQQIQLQLRPAGPQVSLDLSAQFVPGKDRGVLAAFMPRASAISRFAALIPEGATAFKAGHFDAAQLYRAIESTMAEFEHSFRLFESEEDTKQRPDLETIRKRQRASATADLGVDPVDGLLAYIDTDGLICGNLEDLDARGQFLFAMRLRDEKAFLAAFDKVLEKGKGIVNKFEDVEHGDVKFGRYGVTLLGNVYCAVARGMLVIAGGEDGEGQVKRLLDAANKAPASGEPKKAPSSVEPAEPTGLPTEFAPLARHLPPGCNGVGASTIGLTLQMLLSGARDVLGPVVGSPFPIEALDEEALEQLTEMLKQHHLDRVRTMSGYAEVTWRMRIFW